jgi:retron-type reverse transcriptase
MSIYEDLSSMLFLDQEDIIKYIKRAPYRYKVYSIPKKNNTGYREIAQPAKELKILQRLALRLPLLKLPVHHSAKAYVKNIGIKNNALTHEQSKYLLKMDFKNFFPSITEYDLVNHVRRYHGNLSKDDEIALKKLFFYRRKHESISRLSIGAPSSPFLSNSLLYEFDEKIHNTCSKSNIKYTRYADDLTFTTNIKGVLFEIPATVQTIINELEYPKLNINHSKTVFSSKKNNRHVTGLVLTNDNKISLGRNKKRYIKSLVYKFKKSELTEKEIATLKGLIGFSKYIEPAFHHSLIEKYGKKTILSIEKH